MIISTFGRKKKSKRRKRSGKIFLLELFRSKTVKQVTYRPEDARRSGHDNLQISDRRMKSKRKFLIDVCCTCIMSDNVLAVGLF